MPRLPLAAVVAAGAVAVLVAGCSSSPAASTPAADSSSAAASSTAAPAGLDAAKAGTAVADAAKKASAVHVRGTISDEGSTVNLDVQLNPDSASGTIVKDGIEVPVLRVGSKYYFRFTSSLIKQAGLPASAGKLLQDKWVPSTAKVGAGIGEAFKQFLDYKTFTDNTVGQLASSTFTGGEPTTIGSTAAQKFTSPDGTATIATAEPHYLLRMEEAKKGTMEFGDWDKPTTVHEPAAGEIYSGPGS